MSDVLVSLRKLDFPKSVNAAIVQATSFASTKDEGIPGLMTSDELAQEIVAEFILCQKGNKVEMKYYVDNDKLVCIIL